MDVPASALGRRVAGKQRPDVLRFRHTRSIALDPACACQLCGARERLVVLEPVVDVTLDGTLAAPTGQRITVAFCLPCLAHAVALFNGPPPPPPRRRRPAERAR